MTFEFVLHRVLFIVLLQILSVGIRVACWKGLRAAHTELVIGLAIQNYTISSYRSAGMPDLTMCLRFGCTGCNIERC